MQDDGRNYHADSCLVHTNRNPFLEFAAHVRSRAATADNATPRALLNNKISLERAYVLINARRERERRAPQSDHRRAELSAVALPPLAPAPGRDLFAQTVEGARPLLADSSLPTKTRIRLLWATAKKARRFGAADVVFDAFTALAVETGLINKRGHWTGTDVRDYVRWHGAEDVAHVITWALRGWNPFEAGPLK